MKKNDHTNRIYLVLSLELAKDLDTYCLAYAKRKGRYLTGLRQKIGRAALKEWLEKHRNDLTILDAEEDETET